MRQGFLRPFVKEAKSNHLVSVDGDPELDDLEALEADINETPDNCADDDEDDATDERGEWVNEEDEDADDTLPQLEDMAAIDEETYVSLGELRESDRKEAVGLLTKVSVLY